jgi:hypothetical protein
VAQLSMFKNLVFLVTLVSSSLVFYPDNFPGRTWSENSFVEFSMLVNGTTEGYFQVYKGFSKLGR